MEHRGPSLRGFLALIIFALTATFVHAELSYSFPEEMKRGSVVGNIAKDIGLDVTTLSARKARLVSEEDRKQYFNLNLRTGELMIADRVDREELCLEQLTCLLRLELMLETPLELHRMTFQIQDINDNSPIFPKDSIKLEIRESADKGARFRVNEAHDVDVGQNAVTGYTLERNNHFVLSANSNKDGGKNIELVLDKELDREQQQDVTLVLSAFDGGTPPRSGTVAIHVTVLDANDNAPVFSQEVYKASLPENAPLYSVVVKVSATDADEGPNGEVSYEFSRISSKAKNIFSLDSVTGEIRVIGTVDFEDEKKYEMRIEGKDGFGLSTDARSLNNHIPEDVPPDTEVGIVNVQDRDSDKNRQVRCSIQENVPFKLVPSIKNYYSLVTAGDADIGENSVKIYSLQKNDHFVLKVHSSTDGDKYSELVLDKELDREQRDKVVLILTATDGGIPPKSDNGSPPLGSNVTVRVHVKDENDNSPQILYPTPDGKSLMTEMVPKAAQANSIVSKVIAVDADSGQNSWLSYHIIKASDPGLFVIDVDGTGTIRSAYNYDAYLTTGSRTSDFKFVESYTEGTMPIDMTLKKSASDDLLGAIDTVQARS
ncbi:protocadherin gamma-A11-like [Sardina pilchardus]|uniref:protocadherin gamma-A11-like n=1 Tax=Sardina pilchardus TaxID=27697 RepID=UPI002E0F6A6A